MSTKAPKSAMLRTTPETILPSVSILISVKSSRKGMLGNSSRGSNPGLVNSLIISFKVASPILKVCAKVLVSDTSEIFSSFEATA